MREISQAGELFGEAVRELRKEAGLTQIDLAALTETPQSYISDMERGMILPNLVTLMRLAIALKCTVGDLVAVFNKRDLRKLLPK